MARIKNSLCLLAAAAMMLVCTGCSREETQLGKSFRFPLGSEPRQLDPQVASDAVSAAVVSSLFEGLTRVDDDGNAVPAAATWTVSPDGLTYTFTLRDTKWSNGEPVTAADFVFGMQRAVNPSTNSSLADQLFGIAGAREIAAGTRQPEELGVTAPDSKTLVITLEEPDTSFPEKVAGLPFMPCNQAFFEGTGGRYGKEAEFILTNGPFSLAAWSHGEYLRLAKMEHYHAAADIYPASITYLISNTQDPVASLLSGSLDAVELTAAQASAAAQEGVRVVELEDTIQYIWLNNTVPALSNADIRRALRDALEWETIAAQFDPEMHQTAVGYAAPDSLLAGSEKYRQDANALTPVTDAQKARQELEAGLAALDIGSLSGLKVLCADDEYSQQVAMYVVQSWQKNLQVYCDIEAVPADTLAARVQVGNYQIAICAHTAGDMSPLDAFSVFTTDAVKGNPARFSDAEVDARMAELRNGSPDRQAIEALEQLLYEKCPSIPLAFQTRFYGVPQTVGGLVIRPFGGGRYGTPLDFRHAGKAES